MIMQLVKKCLGVKDIASMRLSLPASLLEPIPNLEHSQYLDRPDIFAAINDDKDELMRMLAVIRFCFTKDLKYVHGKVCKPYNSVLGEFFRAHWDIVPVSQTDPLVPSIYTSQAAAASATPSLVAHSETASIKSRKNEPIGAARSVTDLAPGRTSAEAPSSTAAADNLAAGVSSLSLTSSASQGDDRERVRIAYLTEQVSHHPPISAYYAACPSRHIEMLGIDQVAAKVSGTTLRVAPGSFNKGIYIKLSGGPGAGETYQLTHPTATVNGLLRGSFYVTIGESTIITCEKEGGEGQQRYRAVLEYKEESWLGRAQYLIEGVIHTYIQGETAHESWTRVKNVPTSKVVAHIDGSWRHLIRWRYSSFPKSTSSSSSSSNLSPESAQGHPRPSTSSSKIHLPESDEWATLVDLSTLRIIPKGVRPIENQLPRESRNLWQAVTKRLLSKEYGDATREKVNIEQIQRDEAAERKRTGEEFVPAFFEKDLVRGWSELTEKGRKMVEEEMAEPSRYCLELAKDGEKGEKEKLETDPPLV